MSCITSLWHLQSTARVSSPCFEALGEALIRGILYKQARRRKNMKVNEGNQIPGTSRQPSMARTDAMMLLGKRDGAGDVISRTSPGSRVNPSLDGAAIGRCFLLARRPTVCAPSLTTSPLRSSFSFLEWEKL
ncbi:uncharacterized protein LOC144022920 [Festucalex cinctus]